MTDIFLKLVNMSISASWLVMAALLLRPLLRRAPKWVRCVLWALVALRLVLPFSIESTFSLIPSGETISPEIVYTQKPAIYSGIPVVNSIVNPLLSNSFAPDPAASANPLQIWISAAIGIWLTGIAAILLYAVISWLRLKRKLKTAVLLQENIWRTDGVASPFVLGICRPQIYVPFHTADRDLPHVIAHEQMHIQRKDHWIKPLSFLLLSLYWFNPILWLAYILLCRDIELACDEKVIKALDQEQRANYSQALLACSVPHSIIAACPLAFGEIGVQARIKNVLHYKKATFWIIAAAVIVCIITGVCFLTNPKRPSDGDTWPALADIRQNYSAEQAAADGCVVFDGNTLLAGEEYWVNFVNGTTAGRPGVVRIYQTYSEQGDHYYVKELRYDGENYMLQFYDQPGDSGEEFLFQSTYRYLVHSRYTWNDRNGDYYLLADSPEVTAEGYLSSIVSSAYKPEYDLYNHCHLVYCNAIRDDYYLDSYYGVAFADVDGDGQTEKCCLGMGRTSGLFTFTLSVYSGQDLKYHNSFCTEFYNLSFVQASNGALQVQGVTQGPAPETHLFDIVVKDGNIDLEAFPSEIQTAPAALTRKDVLRLSEKGADLTWADFEDYSYVETGSGLYIRVYEIDEMFSLQIGGVDIGSPPLYIHLSANDESEAFTDIRTGDAAAFFTEHENNTVVKNLTCSWISSPVGYSEDGAAAFYARSVSYMELALSSRQYLPYVLIQDKADFDRFYREMGSYFDFTGGQDGEDTFSAAAAQYDAAFFEKNALYLFYITASATNVRYDVEFAQRYGDTLSIGVMRTDPEQGDAAMSGWLLSLCIEKAFLSDITYTTAHISATLYPNRGIGNAAPVRSYTCEMSDTLFKPTVVLFDNGMFSFTFSAVSSYIGVGQYEIIDGRLILHTDDLSFTYVFDMADDTLVFDADASSKQVWFSGITDGSVFK